MKAIVQRVLGARLNIDGKEYSSINKGIVILLGIKNGDDEASSKKLADKCSKLRIFEDEKGIPNLSVNDIDGEIMVVSNFTLYGDASHGNRPSYIEAAKPEISKPLYEHFISSLVSSKEIKTGVFGADMKLNLINDGPFTIIIEI